jgi:hypothetical protein
MFLKVQFFKTVRLLAKYTSDICKSFNQSIMSKKANWWNLRAENVMKTWDIFLIISLFLTAVWCSYTLIVFLGFIFV